MNVKPTTKAALVTGFFGLMFLLAQFVLDIPAQIRWPIDIFYAILLFNTYFSVRLFSEVIPASPGQDFIDLLLVIFFGIILSWSTASAAFFALILTLVFAICVIKYGEALYHTYHPQLMKRKIIVDALGTLMSLLVLGGILAGYVVESLWVMVILFTIANVLTFSIWPLYRLDE